MKKTLMFSASIFFVLCSAILAFSFVSVLTSPPVSAGNYDRLVAGPAFLKALEVSGASRFVGGIVGSTANTAELTADASFAFTPWPSSVAVTSGSTVDPYRPFVVLTAAGAVSTSATTAIADGWNDGQICTLTNGSANPITVKNSANTLLGADIALGQYDTLSLWWDGDNWIRYANSDN